ncbi:acetate--CoA ligase family protein [Haloplanus aerogenes]|uniref:acetate--CoA ligase (ADP-forming) n=1 Tax=Haloplanus aerogenes TaxID=660522 RepID=A0A3M0E0C8_9EURY|nr:acetate--CoA ligase [Haloplanus aerogenes]AZH25510.1 CoA-binding protein [Haloplanus aerogenes]RMB25223.1 acetyltransferase [Haloplanus aerogenes]
MGRLSSLFTPERVAVIGATERPGSVGRALVENLQADFGGEIVPVNPNCETVCGLDCVDHVGETDADLAVVAVPAAVAVDVVREAGEAGIDDVVVITAGFGETGGEGADRERDLEAVAEEYDLNLVGPNCLGIISTPVGLNATFAPRSAPSGSVSFLSQSGAFVTAVLDWAADHGVGFKDVVSLGNKAVLDETDFVESWGDDEGTDVIVGYLESIEDGRRFVDVAGEVTRETPVVVVKSGRTEAGAQAASSHTGAMAGRDRAYEAGLRQAGVIRADTVQDLFDAARVLAGQPVPETDGVAVVTNAGGPGVMATDAVGDGPLSLAKFGNDTVSRLRDRLPEGANVYNPVDAIGDADNERLRAAVDTVLADDAVGSAVVIAAPTATLDFVQLAADVADLQADHGLPVTTCLMGGERAREADDTLVEAGIPNYFDPARAVGSLGTLERYRAIRERERREPTTYDVDREAAQAVLDRARERGTTRLGVEAMSLLDAYGIPTPAGEVVDSPVDALEVAEDVGEPVVMKIVSPDILHKSDIGGVKVGVDHADVYDAFEDLVARARNYQPDATILGVQVQEMVETESGVETIVGTNRDPQFGPLILFGLGGIFVEVMEDTAVRIAPLAEADAREMTEEIQAAPLLSGARGRDPVDRDAVAETLCRLSQLVTDFPEILELDVNPLVVRPDGAVAVDLRLTIEL